MGSVIFRNSYSSRIFVAYQRKNPACTALCGEPWDVLGWINLAPGQTQTRANPTGSRWYYYYAEAEDGAIWDGAWGGDVLDVAFQKCDCLSGPTGWYRVKMDQIDLATSGGIEFI
jgi:hypothetical protein